MTTITRKAEDINEKVNRLEKRFEEFEKRNNDNISPKEDKQVQEESAFQVTMYVFKLLAICMLGAIVIAHLMLFAIFSYGMLDLKIELAFERYIVFFQESTCKFYQLFGYCK